MARTSTSNVRPLSAARRRTTPTPSGESATALNDLAAAWMQAPLRAAASFGQFAEQVQHIGSDTLQALERDAEIESAEARTANTPQDVFGLQMALACDPWMRCGEMGAQMLGGWFDLQARLWHDAEAALATWLRLWTGGGPRTPYDPLGLWLNAITHDLLEDRDALRA